MIAGIATLTVVAVSIVATDPIASTPVAAQRRAARGSAMDVMREYLQRRHGAGAQRAAFGTDADTHGHALRDP
jgi:hypothetical protein